MKNFNILDFIKKHKILLTIFSFIFSFFLFNNNVFAKTHEIFSYTSGSMLYQILYDDSVNLLYSTNTNTSTNTTNQFSFPLEDNYHYVIAYSEYKKLYYVYTNEGMDTSFHKLNNMNIVNRYFFINGEDSARTSYFSVGYGEIRTLSNTNLSSSGSYTYIPINFDMYLNDNTTLYKEDVLKQFSSPKINSLEFKEDIFKKNNFIASNYELTIDNYSEDYNYYFAYSSCIDNENCYNLMQLKTKKTYNHNLGEFNYQEDYLLNINGLIDENGKINISLFENDSIIVLINDKEDNYIESKTFTITQVDEKRTNLNIKPYFTVENKTTDSCKIYENETEYKLCTKFKIYVNDMIDVHDYILYESINSPDDFKEKLIWNNSISVTLYKNGDYAIYKLTDLEGNIIDTVTVNAAGITFNDNDNKVYFKYESSYNEDTKNAVVKYYFYNYNFDNYKIYYSDNGICTDFNEITLDKENDIVGSYQQTYDQSKTICIEITDLEGNYINSFTYSLDYFSIMKNDYDNDTFDYMFNYLKELTNNGNKIFIYMTDVYNKIISSKLGSYITLIIFSCIIILILKALSR